MARQHEGLATIQEILEKIATRLSHDAVTRHELLDSATALTVVAHMLHRADHEMQGYALRTGPFSVEWPLYQLDQCLLAVRRDRASESDGTIRADVEEAVRHARDALDILRQRKAP